MAFASHAGAVAVLRPRYWQFQVVSLHSGAVHDGGEELTAEPRHLSRRTLLLAGCLLTLLLALSLLTGKTTAPGCLQPPRTSTPQPSARPAISPSDPGTDLHFAALDRSRRPGDIPPADVLPADMHRSARKLGDTADVAVYLARGSGFACLGVDGRPRHYDIASLCLLDTTIAHQGLNATIVSDAAEESLLIVAVPDGAGLLTQASTDRVADYSSVVVLRPRHDRVLLQQPGRPSIVVSQDDTQQTQPSSSC